MNDHLKEGLERTLGAVEEPSRGLKAVLAFAVLGVAIVVAAIYSRSPNLSHVDVAFLSGSERGNYYAVVSRLAGGSWTVSRSGSPAWAELSITAISARA